MRTLILLATFLVSFGFTYAVVAADGDGVILLDTAADVKKALCNVVANNGVATMNNINAGIPVDATIAELNRVFSDMGVDNEFASYAHSMSVGVAQALYDQSGTLVAKTEEELDQIGKSVFLSCYQNTHVQRRPE